MCNNSYWLFLCCMHVYSNVHVCKQVGESAATGHVHVQFFMQDGEFTCHQCPLSGVSVEPSSSLSTPLPCQWHHSPISPPLPLFHSSSPIPCSPNRRSSLPWLQFTQCKSLSRNTNCHFTKQRRHNCEDKQ